MTGFIRKHSPANGSKEREEGKRKNLAAERRASVKGGASPCSPAARLARGSSAGACRAALTPSRRPARVTGIKEERVFEMSLTLHTPRVSRASLRFALEFIGLVASALIFAVTVYLIVAGPDFLMSGCETLAGLD
ncbi:hypothetical protein [Kozakia baliensis]|uniref:hypothetical protein n=1 Tax=Kozakia baliensis TaxID=153496 RepID=UPI00087A99AE|nr:hypothetical protein [Kozakia baliensis]AOX21525.1 hypothetical protein A0U90_13560 [Kozakia baliensis]